MNQRTGARGIVAEAANTKRWDDLLAVFGRQGGYSGCWCMYWRLKRTELGRIGVPPVYSVLVTSKVLTALPFVALLRTLVVNQ